MWHVGPDYVRLGVGLESRAPSELLGAQADDDPQVALGSSTTDASRTTSDRASTEYWCTCYVPMAEGLERVNAAGVGALIGVAAPQCW